jgi:hypothetical protein
MNLLDHRTPRRAAWLAIAAAVAAGALAAPSAAAGAEPRGSDVIEGRYVVV